MEAEPSSVDQGASQSLEDGEVVSQPISQDAEAAAPEIIISKPAEGDEEMK